MTRKERAENLIELIKENNKPDHLNEVIKRRNEILKENKIIEK